MPDEELDQLLTVLEEHLDAGSLGEAWEIVDTLDLSAAPPEGYEGVLVGLFQRLAELCSRAGHPVGVGLARFHEGMLLEACGLPVLGAQAFGAAWRAYLDALERWTDDDRPDEEIDVDCPYLRGEESWLPGEPEWSGDRWRDSETGEHSLALHAEWLRGTERVRCVQLAAEAVTRAMMLERSEFELQAGEHWSVRKTIEAVSALGPVDGDALAAALSALEQALLLLTEAPDLGHSTDHWHRAADECKELATELEGAADGWFTRYDTASEAIEALRPSLAQTLRF